MVKGMAIVVDHMGTWAEDPHSAPRALDQHILYFHKLDTPLLLGHVEADKLLGPEVEYFGLSTLPVMMVDCYFQFDTAVAVV